MSLSPNVPAKIDTSKAAMSSLAGVGLRELVIVGSGTVVGLLLAIALPVGWPVKIAVAVFVGGLGLWLAIGRDQESKKKLEEILMDFLGFARRPKTYQRGYSADDTAWDAVDGVDYVHPGERRVYFSVRAMPFSFLSLISISSLSFLAGVIAWIWTGGLEYLLLLRAGY